MVIIVHTYYDSDQWITENINIRVLLHYNWVAHILLNFVKKVFIEVWHDTQGSQDYIAMYGVWCYLILSIWRDKK